MPGRQPQKVTPTTRSMLLQLRTNVACPNPPKEADAMSEVPQFLGPPKARIVVKFDKRTHMHDAATPCPWPEMAHVYACECLDLVGRDSCLHHGGGSHVCQPDRRGCHYQRTAGTLMRQLGRRGRRRPIGLDVGWRDCLSVRCSESQGMASRREGLEPPSAEHP